MDYRLFELDNGALISLPAVEAVVKMATGYKVVTYSMRKQDGYPLTYSEGERLKQALITLYARSGSNPAPRASWQDAPEWARHLVFNDNGQQAWAEQRPAGDGLTYWRKAGAWAPVKLPIWIEDRPPGE